MDCSRTPKMLVPYAKSKKESRLVCRWHDITFRVDECKLEEGEK